MIMNEKKDELVAAIIKVMQAVKGMEKNSQVGSGRMAYSGTKDQDVKEVFNDALSHNGLCMLPMDIEESTELSRWEETNEYGTKQKQSVFTKVKVKYLLCHESGQSQVICGYGHGVDSQDKGAGKATTYAMKNALLYTFLTPVGKIDDTDTTHSQEIEAPQASQPEPKKKTTLKVNSREFNNGIENNASYEKMKEYYFITEEVMKAYLKALEDGNN